MTIQDALERAKKLGQERAGLTRELRDDSIVANASKESQSFKSATPVEQFANLEVIDFNLQICAENNILIADDQQGTAGHAAASYRLLRGRLLHRIKSGNWSAIGITSAGSGEGKTTTAVNLAISVAREKQRMVYLLDLDMRNPSVFKKLGCQPSIGLPQYFSSGITPDQVLYQTSVESLAVAGATEPTRGASEMLASSKLDELLRHIRRRSPNGFVIMDLPPVLSTDEALVVAPRTDALLLVVSEGVTRRDALARSVEVLGDVNVAGIILNRSSEKLGTDYYGY